MLFKKGEHKQKRGFGGIFGIFRMFLSLIIMAVLLLAIYQAYKTFSGVDPLKTNPQSLIKSFMSSDSAYKLVTGLLTLNPKTSLSEAKKIINQQSSTPNSTDSIPTQPVLYRFAIVTDSHNDNDNLGKALNQAKEADVKFIIALGDYSDVGTIDELKAAKAKLDEIGLPYYSTAGDHDLWDSRNRNLPAINNYNQVFGPPYQAFSYQNTRFIIVFDADNYFGLDDAQMNWISQQLADLKTGTQKLTLVLTSSPFYHPSSDHVMGKTNAKLKVQADNLVNSFKDAGVGGIIAGDTHEYSSYTDPRTNLKMTTVGAVTSTRNPQSSRFAIVDVYEDGGYNIEDTEIK